MWAPCGLVKLTYKLNHHSWLLSEMVGAPTHNTTCHTGNYWPHSKMGKNQRQATRKLCIEVANIKSKTEREERGQ